MYIKLDKISEAMIIISHWKKCSEISKSKRLAAKGLSLIQKIYKMWKRQTIASPVSCSYNLDNVTSFPKEKLWMCKLPDTNYKLTRSVMIIVLAMIFLLSFHILNFLRLSSPLRQRKISLPLPGWVFSKRVGGGIFQALGSNIRLKYSKFQINFQTLTTCHIDCKFAMQKDHLLKDES